MRRHASRKKPQRSRRTRVCIWACGDLDIRVTGRTISSSVCAAFCNETGGDHAIVPRSVQSVCLHSRAARRRARRPPCPGGTRVVWLRGDGPNRLDRQCGDLRYESGAADDGLRWHDLADRPAGDRVRGCRGAEEIGDRGPHCRPRAAPCGEARRRSRVAHRAERVHLLRAA